MKRLFFVVCNVWIEKNMDRFRKLITYRVVNNGFEVKKFYFNDFCDQKGHTCSNFSIHELSSPETTSFPRTQKAMTQETEIYDHVSPLNNSIVNFLVFLSVKKNNGSCVFCS